MSYLLINNNFNYQNRILAFDMDYTIIKPKSNRRFPKDKDDWKFIFNSQKMLQKKSKKYSIIIISNQLGISKGKTTVEDIKYKIKNIFKQLNVPALAIISTDNDKIRKPRIGSFQVIEKLYSENNKQFSKFYYIGDAAGRINDHSDSDYKYLLNVASYTDIKTKFYTPEEFFLKEKSIEKNISGYKLNYNGNDTFEILLLK